MKPKDSPGEYAIFLSAVRQKIRDAQYSALKAVNKGLISLYWDLGKMIVGRQEKLNWGDGIIETLAMDLQNEFPGIRGFSKSNLWYIRQFYVEYQHDTFIESLIREIGWTHHIILIKRCKDKRE